MTRRQFAHAAGVAALGVLGAGYAAAAGGCSQVAEDSGEMRTVVDAVGRTVEIPSPRLLQRIYFTSALAQVFCFTVAPDLLAGTCIHFDENQLEFLPDGTGDLPYLGTLSGGGSIDTEALGYMGVQVIFSISGVDLTDVNVADAVSLQDQTGIPVVLIDGSFGVIGDTYRFLGDCLGRRERANQLASYCEDIYASVIAAVGQVPPEDRVTYYFAEGREGLQTEPNASQHSLAFTSAGAVNVAGDLGYEVGSMEMAETTVDQVISWDPDFIICWDREYRDGATRHIREYEAWQPATAVREGRVFEMPYLPFPFCDRPPGMNRFLGIQWLANLFYPDRYDVDMVEVTRDFYSRCYWCDITADQAREILGTSLAYVRSVRGKGA